MLSLGSTCRQTPEGQQGTRGLLGCRLRQERQRGLPLQPPSAGSRSGQVQPGRQEGTGQRAPRLQKSQTKRGRVGVGHAL